jgi:hypothetical protein
MCWNDVTLANNTNPESKTRKLFILNQCLDKALCDYLFQTGYSAKGLYACVTNQNLLYHHLPFCHFFIKTGDCLKPQPISEKCPLFKLTNQREVQNFAKRQKMGIRMHFG